MTDKGTDDEKKYIIYSNDLKYRKYRKIKKEDVIYGDEFSESLFDVDLDTIEYRIKECKNNSYDYLDLNYLEISNSIKFPESILNKLKHLSIMGNNLVSIPDLFMFKNLISLDISHNCLTTITAVPDSLIELDMSYNKISDIKTLEKSNLKRLKCSHNEIKEFPTINTLENIHCQHNHIEIFNITPNLLKLFCIDNKIKKLALPINCRLEYIDCRNNLLDSVPLINSLKELYVNNNQLTDIDVFPQLTIFECLNNRITKIKFMKNLKELVCNYDENLVLSKEFKIKESNLCDDKYLILRFE